MTASPLNAKRIDIWHNILWSQYKGEVFSALHNICRREEFDLRFFHIAETEGNRTALSGVDLNRHRYPYDLVFKGSYERTRLFRRLVEVSRRTLRSEADLVILAGYERAEYWAQLLILKLMRKKVAVFCDSTVHDRMQSFVRGAFKTAFFRAVNGFFCYGARSKDYVIRYGADPATAFHRCQAAALPFDYVPEVALRTRLAGAPAADAPRFLYIGRLSPEKGLGTLIDAFARVKHQSNKATLILVGSGPLRSSLEECAGGLGLSGSVQFTGSKSGDALFREYAMATALVLPSTSEPWGLVANEALSYGCPAIVSDRCGCVPELIIDGITGFVHTADDADSLAAKMLAAPTQFADIEKTARDCLALIANYTPDHAAAQIIAGCRTILADGYSSQRSGS